MPCQAKGAIFPSLRPRAIGCRSRATALVGGGLASCEERNVEISAPLSTVRAKVDIAFMPRMEQALPDVTIKEMDAVMCPMTTGTEMTRSMGMGDPLAAWSRNCVVGMSRSGTPAAMSAW